MVVTYKCYEGDTESFIIPTYINNSLFYYDPVRCPRVRNIMSENYTL